MADSRALEEQMERHNPVNPKNSLSNRREKVLRNVGAGATPSMGLSEFRGGSHSEARMMGHNLGRHLFGLHGGAFHKDFCDGMVSGGRMTDEQMMERHEQAERAGPKGLSLKELREQHNRTAENEYAREHPIAHAVGKHGMRAVEGLTNALVEHGDKVGVPKGVIEGVKSARDVAHGKGKTGAYEGKGMPHPIMTAMPSVSRGGKKRRSPASAGDGRRKRAEIVKKVMAEKGMKMIEASKYVKQHGLY